MRPWDLAACELEWRIIQHAFAVEAAPQLKRLARRCEGLPWAWLAERLLAWPEAAALSCAARSAVSRDAWPRLRLAGTVAVLAAGHGTDLDYMTFDFEDRVFALSSRIKPEGLFVDIDLAPPIPPRRIIRTETRSRRELPVPK